MTRKTILLFLFLSLFALPALADYSPENWRYFKDVEIKSGLASGRLVQVALDRDIFDKAKNDLSDLRVIDQSGAETAYKLIVEKGTFDQNNLYPVTILNNSYAQDQYNYFIVDFGQSGLLNSEIKILTGSQNFTRSVQISGSNDAASWNILKNSGYIYDYTDTRGNFKAQNTSVAYPENTFRYLEVKIFSGGEAPLQISGAQVSRIAKSEIKETSLRPKFQNYEGRGANTISGTVIDLEKKGWPTNAIILESPSENFNREVVVYESNDKVNWRRLSQGYIFNYNTPKFKGSSLSLSYPESNSRYLKVEIFNGDNQPITISGVSVKAILRNIVFIFAPGKNYRLYYGNAQARFPEYDLEKFFAYLDTENFAKASLGLEQANSFFKETEPPLPPLSERIPYLLPTALVLVILLLGFFVFRFIKQVK